MKIAVYHNLPSGGAKHTLYEAVKRLSKQHLIDVHTLNTSDSQFYSLREYANAEFCYQYYPSRLFPSPFGRLNQLQRWIDLLRLDNLARKIGKTIDSMSYDVVFAQPCMWTQAPLILRHLQTPTVYYCHELPRHFYETSFEDMNSKSGFQRTLDYIDPFMKLYHYTGKYFDYLSARSAELLLANSTFISEQAKMTYKIEPIVNYHGVDTDAFHPRSIKSKRNYVLSVGAIRRHKGYRFLVESIGHIDHEMRPALHLIGNMENHGERDFLMALADDNDVQLHIEVGVDQNTLIQRYNEALLVVYAPYNEPFGLVPLEAMACGIPVVGVCEGGIKETVIHEKTGLLISRNVQQFGAAVQYLLENPDMIDIYGNNGRKHVLDNWTWETSIHTLAKYLEDCSRNRAIQ